MSIEINVTNEVVEINEVTELVEINVTGGIGPAGAGVPAGGTTGQFLAKNSNTNYDTEWIDLTITDKVPYTGATTNVDLGEFELKAGQVEFDQTPTGTAGVGVLRWNDSDGTLDLGLKGGNVTLQVGQEQVTRVVNKSGVNLTEAGYQVVKVLGAQGQRLSVMLAQANNDAGSAETLGIVTENININQEGYITTSGLVRGIDTRGVLQGETWAEGDMLYLSGTTAGALTKVKPIAPIHSVVVGYVISAAPNGSIYVKVTNGQELDELHNVAIVNPLNNQVLQYESATLLWKNKTVDALPLQTGYDGYYLQTNGTIASWQPLVIDNTASKLFYYYNFI
jgi:hypothetical protein